MIRTAWICPLCQRTFFLIGRTRIAEPFCPHTHTALEGREPVAMRVAHCRRGHTMADAYRQRKGRWQECRTCKYTR